MGLVYFFNEAKRNSVTRMLVPNRDSVLRGQDIYSRSCLHAIKQKAERTSLIAPSIKSANDSQFVQLLVRPLVVCTVLSQPIFGFS